LLINRNLADTRKTDLANSIVENLFSADIDNVPEIIRDVGEFRRDSDPRVDQRLLAEFERASYDSSNKLRAAMALLPVQDQHCEFLCGRLLDCRLEELAVIRDTLLPHRQTITARLWETFRDEDLTRRDKRFRAGLTLANYAPDDDQWNGEDAAFLTGQLLSHPVEEQPVIRQFLFTIKEKLYPDLQVAFQNPEAREREAMGSAIAFASFAVDDPVRIAQLSSEASANQFHCLFPVLEKSSDSGVRKALSRIVTLLPQSDLTQPARIAMGRRRAGAAITLLRLGFIEDCLQVFEFSDDPESLTQFVHRCRERDVTPDELMQCLQLAADDRQNQTAPLRHSGDRSLYGLLLALGEFALDEIPPAMRQRLTSQLIDWYAHDESSTIHGVTGWLLRRWGLHDDASRIDETPVAMTPGQEWFVLKVDAPTNSQLSGHESQQQSLFLTFIVFASGQYDIGSPDDEEGRQNDEPLQKVRINRPFAVLDREITRSEFLALGGQDLPVDTWSSPDGSNPMVGPAWYEAVIFCRVLTRQFGLKEDDQAYVDPASLPEDEFPRETDESFNRFPLNWPINVDLPGFRIPTEAEWEIACRGGMRSMYGFGSDQSLLHHYGWFLDNASRQAHAPYALRPNFRGLFDMHGNVWEWCHDWDGAAREPSVENPVGAATGSSRLLRGGSWYFERSHGRSANRYVDDPALRYSDRGFRVAFTLPANYSRSPSLAPKDQ
ncbi:MAG: formylglycine-generating enzyme family protein, partial [Pirellulaceae bacterium]